jgi:hypothetical protein
VSASEREREWSDKELRAAIDEMLRLVNDAKLAAYEQGKLAARPPAGHIMLADGRVKEVSSSSINKRGEITIVLHSDELAEAAQRAAGGGA